MSEKKRTGKYGYLLWAVLGTGLFTAAFLFLENMDLSGILGLLGLVCFLTAERKAVSRNAFFTVMAFFALAFLVRYFTVMGLFLEMLLFYLACLLAAILCFVLIFGLDHLLIRGKHRFLAVLAVPGLYVLFKYLTTVTNVENVIDLTTYFSSFPVLFQNTSVLGEFGMSYLCMLVISLLAESFSRPAPKANWLGAVAGTVIVIGLFVSGSVLEGKAVAPDYTLRVALANSKEMDILAPEQDYPDEVYLKMFAEHVRMAKEQGADLMVTGEEYIYLNQGQDPKEILGILSETVKKNQMPVLLCMEWEGDAEEGKLENDIYLFDKNGEIVYRYTKYNLIPLMETSWLVQGTEGPASALVTLGGHRLRVSSVICYDLDDAVFMQQVPEDTELFVVPSWDWDTCNLEQRRLFFRSVELKTTMVKQTYDGFSFVSGPFGLIGEMTDCRGRFDTLDMVTVPIWEKN